MNKIFSIVRQRWLVIVLLIVGTVTTAFAVPPSQVFRSTDFTTFTGPCCFSFGVSIAIDEPSKPVPLVVTWSVTRGASFEDAFSGLMVNSGPCQFFGSGSLADQGEQNTTQTFQWIIFPSDGLKKGTNTITLCGGGAGAFADSAVINIFAHSLAVRLSK